MHANQEQQMFLVEPAAERFVLDLQLMFDPYPACLHSYGYSAGPAQFSSPLLKSSIHPWEKGAVVLDSNATSAGSNRGGNRRGSIDLTRRDSVPAK